MRLDYQIFLKSPA